MAKKLHMRWMTTPGEAPNPVVVVPGGGTVLQHSVLLVLDRVEVTPGSDRCITTWGWLWTRMWVHSMEKVPVAPESRFALGLHDERVTAIPDGGWDAVELAGWLGALDEGVQRSVQRCLSRSVLVAREGQVTCGGYTWLDGVDLPLPSEIYVNTVRGGVRGGHDYLD